MHFLEPTNTGSSEGTKIGMHSCFSSADVGFENVLKIFLNFLCNRVGEKLTDKVFTNPEKSKHTGKYYFQMIPQISLPTCLKTDLIAAQEIALN